MKQRKINKVQYLLTWANHIAMKQKITYKDQK